MASEPMTVFSSRTDVKAVEDLVSRLYPAAVITRGDAARSHTLITFSRGMFRRPLTLKLTHDPNYYQGPNWPQQQAGMLGYFGNIPMADDRRAQVMGTVQSFRFCIGSVAEPEFLASGADPRLELLCAIAGELDGCLFSSNGLLDASGRMLMSADGSFDSSAEFPAFDLGSSPVPMA